MKRGGGDLPPQPPQEKLPSKSPALLGLKKVDYFNFNFNERYMCAMTLVNGTCYINSAVLILFIKSNSHSQMLDK